MRLATFNVENLFDRPSAMNLPTWAEGKKVLDAFNRLNELIEAKVYTDHIKEQIVNLYKENSSEKKNFIKLNEIRDRLLKAKGKSFEVVASGRASWLGWFELEEHSVQEPAIENTARVIREVRPDVLCVIEAEDRPALKRFNETMIPEVGGTPFDHVRLFDGNDYRGIDVAIMAREPAQIVDIVTHVDDKDEHGEIFSRDCAEYTVKTPSGEELLVLVNHFKSKDGKAESDAKRKRQAERVRAIYDARRKKDNGYHKYIAIAGDLNDNPEHGPLDTLLKDGSDLVDVMSHPKFHGDGRPGTFGNGTKDNKIDYILMSPELSEKVQFASIERRGVWGGKNGTLFPHFNEVHNALEAASDHAALFVDLNL